MQLQDVGRIPSLHGPSSVVVVVALSRSGGADSSSSSGESLHWAAKWAGVLCATAGPLRPALVSPATTMPSIKDLLSVHARQRPTEIRDTPRPIPKLRDFHRK